VFSQFASMLALIEAECTRAGISHVTLTGARGWRRDALAAEELAMIYRLL